jgi:hypothetical protein
MKGRWWMGVTAGMVIGLGTVAGVQAATSDGSNGRKVIVSSQQLKINQRISQAAVKRSNDALKNLSTLNSQVPLFAVSSGAVGSNLVRGRGAVLAQRIDDGNYRVKFDRNISACSWSATAASDAPPVADPVTVRLALDTTDVTRTQLVVRTNAGGGGAPPVNAGFHVQVFC